MNKAKILVTGIFPETELKENLEVIHAMNVILVNSFYTIYLNMRT